MSKIKRGQSRDQAVKILVKMFGTNFNRKSMQPIIDYVHELEYLAIKAEAKADDKIKFWEGQIRIIKEHSIQYANIHRKHNYTLKENKELHTETIPAIEKDRDKWKAKALKYANWINNKCKNVLKKRKIKIKIENKKIDIVKIIDKDKKK